MERRWPIKLLKIQQKLLRMAAVTRKRSAFSVFKATNTGKEKKIQSIEIDSTPNLAEIGLSQYEEHKMAVKKKGRIRRGSLPDLNDQDKSEQVNSYHRFSSLQCWGSSGELGCGCGDVATDLSSGFLPK